MTSVTTLKARVIAVASSLALVSCGGGGGETVDTPVTVTPAPTPAPSASETPTVLNRVGFFNPAETVSSLTSRMSFGMINARNPQQVEQSLAAANGTNYKVKIDFDLLLAQRADPSAVGRQYTDSTGASWTKQLPPLSEQKLRRFPSDAALVTLIAPYLQVLKAHASNVGTLFLADEPYLNGISKTEMERAGAVIRQELDKAGLQTVKLGVIFASGMFNAEFAQHLDRASGDYARRLDAYYERGMAIRNGSVSDSQFDIAGFDNWISSVSQSRLTTYDAAGNMYTGGGIPRGFDVVAFDFYLSTVLLDGIHENSLSWLASRSPTACSSYASKAMSAIRPTLSFIQDGPIKQGESYQSADRQILNGIFTCRMTGVLDLLRQAIQGTSAKIMMISESSANGVLEFYSNGSPKTGQPKLLVEARVLDEVDRGINFYTAHKSDFTCGLMFFIFNDAHDYSISLEIYGAASLPSVTDRIYKFAAEQGQGTADSCD